MLLDYLNGSHVISMVYLNCFIFIFIVNQAMRRLFSCLKFSSFICFNITDITQIFFMLYRLASNALVLAVVSRLRLLNISSFYVLLFDWDTYLVNITSCPAWCIFFWIFTVYQIFSLFLTKTKQKKISSQRKKRLSLSRLRF